MGLSPAQRVDRQVVQPWGQERGRFSMPLGATDGSLVMTSDIGHRNTGIAGASHDHNGLDLRAQYVPVFATETGGKVIGVDSDQSPIIDEYGEGMTVTSAMKSLTATIYAMLDAIIVDDTWDEHVGKIENLGLVSGTEMELNYVGLPEDTTQWNENFTVDDYRELVRKIFDGEVVVDSSIDKMPEVKYKLNVRQGTIM